MRMRGRNPVDKAMVVAFALCPGAAGGAPLGLDPVALAVGVEHPVGQRRVDADLVADSRSVARVRRSVSACARGGKVGLGRLRAGLGGGQLATQLLDLGNPADIRRGKSGSGTFNA